MEKTNFFVNIKKISAKHYKSTYIFIIFYQDFSTSTLMDW